MDFRQPWYVPGSLALLSFVLPVQATAQPPQAVGAHVQAAIGHKVSVLVHHAAVAVSHAATVLRHRNVAVAQDDTKNTPSSAPAQGDHGRNAGVVDGQVVSVDYQRGMIGLMTPDRGHVDVMVLPSTNIQGHGDGFHTIADIGRGSHLRIFLSQRAGQFFAQIIHLLH